MNTDYERIRICAFHEAGHTIAFLEHGIALKKVLITVPGIFTGGSGYTELKGGQLPYEADMIATIAGTVAEQMLYDEWGHSQSKAARLAAPGCVSDMEIIQEVMLHTTYTVAEASSAARTLLMNNWQRVQRVAEEIARYGKVPGHRLARIG